MNQHEYISLKDAVAYNGGEAVNGVAATSLDIFLGSTTRKVLGLERRSGCWVVKVMKEK